MRESLREFCNRTGQVDHSTPAGSRYLYHDTLKRADKVDLYHLADYLVSSRSGPVSFLVRRSPTDPYVRLEYLRAELRAERISYGELSELASLVAHIQPGDVELLEAAGVPETPLSDPAVLEHVRKQSFPCRGDSCSE